MDIEELRKQIRTGALILNRSNKIIKTGNIIDSAGASFQYNVSNGWDIISSEQCDREWNGYIIGLFQHIRNQNYSEESLEIVLQSIQLEDIDWDWFKKSVAFVGGEYEWFYLFSDGKPQGACVISHPKDSIIDAKDIFYVEYLAVAPWNRDSDISKRLFKGVGTILISCALDFAKNKLGLHDGFCLHSLSQAKGYYKKIGMENYSQRNKKGMLYFEMPRNQSKKLMGVV